MPSSTWKGSISFGLVSVPIRLFSAARYSHIAFHEIHKSCGTRVRQQLYCPHDERVVSRDEVAMGYEVEKDKYIVIDQAELKNLQLASSTTMEIVQFVKLAEVDPIYFETSYFAVPEEASRRAYALLLNTMDKLKLAAIAQVTMHQRERTVILRPFRDGLIVHTIYYPNEIHAVKEYGKEIPKNLRPQEIDLATQFAQALVKPFKPEQFHDEYQTRVQQLIDSKEAGKAAPKHERQRQLAPVVDLMAALKKSIAAQPQKKSTKLRKTA
jgi:DNA end-binding protein Ku